MAEESGQIYVNGCTDGGVGLLVVGAEGLVVHIKEEDTATVDTGSDGEIL